MTRLTLVLTALLISVAPWLRADPPPTGRELIRRMHDRYAGRWYEVARFPNRFQRRCACETTAEYELLATARCA